MSWQIDPLAHDGGGGIGLSGGSGQNTDGISDTEGETAAAMALAGASGRGEAARRLLCGQQEAALKRRRGRRGNVSDQAAPERRSRLQMKRDVAAVVDERFVDVPATAHRGKDRVSDRPGDSAQRGGEPV